MGAAGGTGAKNPGFGPSSFQPNAGSFTTSIFNLTKGEKIYMLIGQRGEDACEKVSLALFFRKPVKSLFF